MNTAATIVSIIAVLGALILATSSAQFRNLGMSRMLRLALIWGAIIIGLVLVVQLTGLSLEQ
ncbi:hypothetical protein GCM10011494_16040 [Novosphingobium endophyticum]|uniref:Uncharacterized protein n=1 Tax=Novosphingobium endophyticum TaxID=1955250 RepID=A0A916TST3_9SPHN|nr:hypothetical protein [Novosphingobium endophyticum]GGB98337.1 hypothetical protein GCM10011494_16040 [Novosphingobium endophyticum]